ncbi:MAG: hypothetical protein LBU32_21285 [Clostridiales bacterium]|jgi:hypothetical protein|nr:hypothetical protein [Clostridiales bacterium]
MSVKKERKNLTESVSDDEIMELMGIASDNVPTVAGVMIFSKYPQGYFPQLSITAASLPGTEMGETGADGSLTMSVLPGQFRICSNRLWILSARTAATKLLWTMTASAAIRRNIRSRLCEKPP